MIKRWFRVVPSVLMLAALAAQAGIYDNPDGTDQLAKGTSVILDDGTPFLKQKIADPPPTIGSPYNDRLFCANHTGSLSECYSCAGQAFVYGHQNFKFYVSAINACNFVDEFR
jgi:hypothetical protein